MKNILIQVALFCVSVFIAYTLYQVVMEPIEFKKIKKERYESVVANLKEIRKAQVAYKEENGKFTASWDTLVNFVKTDSLSLVYKSGSLTDSLINLGWNEAKALKKGLIIRDTIRVAVIDTLFGKGFDADQLRIIPNTNNLEFEMGATEVLTGSGVTVQVFEARAHNRQIFADLKDSQYEQLIINENEGRRKNDKYPGLRVGSLEEANNNAGNWE